MEFLGGERQPVSLAQFLPSDGHALLGVQSSLNIPVHLVRADERLPTPAGIVEHPRTQPNKVLFTWRVSQMVENLVALLDDNFMVEATSGDLAPDPGLVWPEAGLLVLFCDPPHNLLDLIVEVTKSHSPCSASVGQHDPSCSAYSRSLSLVGAGLRATSGDLARAASEQYLGPSAWRHR